MNTVIALYTQLKGIDKEDYIISIRIGQDKCDVALEIRPEGKELVERMSCRVAQRELPSFMKIMQ